jgi:7-keto-8-aminopelargonate synthetase-like enzyme
MLLLDETHALGVVGANGRGVAHESGLTRHIDIQLGSLGKALGASGGYVCGSHGLIDWLVNRARSFIFSTALAPASAAAATAAIELLESDIGEERRLLLWSRIDSLRAMLAFIPPPPPVLPHSETAAAEPKKPNVLRQFLSGVGGGQGAATVPQPQPAPIPTQSGSAIHPIIVGDERAAIELARSLQAEGFLVPAIRDPIVPQGAARLRIAVTAVHSDAQIRTLAAAINRLRPELSTAA